MKTLSAKEEALLLRIENLKTELNTTNQTLSELQKSKGSLETLVNSIATQWAIETTNTTPVPQDTPSSHETKKTKSKKATNKRVRSKPEPSPSPSPSPGPDPEDGPETNTIEHPVEPEEGFIVCYKGVDYVVFPDNLDVVREDDKEEEVVGRWDPENKVVVFN